MLILALVLVLGSSLAAHADEDFVLVLRSGEDKISDRVAAGFREKFEGQVLELSLDKASKEDVQEIKDRGPRMLVAVGNGAIKLSLTFSADIPVIFCGVDEITLLNISRRNTVAIINESSLVDQFRSFKEFMPGLKTLGVIYSPGRSQGYIKEAESAAREHGITLLARPVESIKDFPSTVREVIPQVNAVWAVSDPEFSSREAFNYFLLIAFENSVPVVASSPRLVKSGAVFAYAPDYRLVGEKAAEIAQEILSGQAPCSKKVSVISGQAVINQKTTSLFNIPVDEEMKENALLY